MADPTATGSVWPPQLIRIAGWGPWLIGGYFVLQALGRFLVSPALELDEAEQVLAAQQLALGYGPQPPLYTWLQRAVFGVLGDGVLALAVLKNTLLAATVLGAFRIARELQADPPVALLAALSLALVPSFVWEAQRDLSHTVLALAATTAAVLAFLRLLARGRALDHALFGVTFAACALAKYNAVLLPFALVLAALSLPAARSRLLTSRLALAAAVALVAILPHAIWVAGHPSLVLADTHKFGTAASEGGVRGLWPLARAVLVLAGPTLLVFGFAWIGRPGAAIRRAERPLQLRLLIRALLVGLGLAMMLVVAFDVGQLKERWLLPGLFLLPVVIAVDQGARLGAARVRALHGLTAGLALLVLFVLIGRAPLGPWLGEPNRLNFPITAIAGQIRADGSPDLVLSTSRRLGGNLRLAFPEAPVIVPVLARPPLPEAGCWLLVWREEAGAALPPILRRMLVATAQADGIPALTGTHYRAPLLYGAGTPAGLRAAWVEVRPEADGARRIEPDCEFDRGERW